MGFFSFNLAYYSEVLEKIESTRVTPRSIYRAKQLLKILTDLQEEGYLELAERLEGSIQGVTRLKRYLQANHAEPFAPVDKVLLEGALTYLDEDLELEGVLDSAWRRSKLVKEKREDPFLERLWQFCRWVGYEKDTAYIFLLRDALLPYIYYKARGCQNIYPWLLARRTLEVLVGKKGLDDEIRARIYETLETGQVHDFQGFLTIALPAIRGVLSHYSGLEASLRDLLNGIQESRLVVIESGCTGTFPLLLMSLDERVEMRMYTTYPYLLDIYGDNIFTERYEENRLFETMYSQDLYLRFSNLKDGYFYVNKCQSPLVEKEALAEIRAMLP